jgi:cytochrome c-type biogenesis protein CcmH/NrfG
LVKGDTAKAIDHYRLILHHDPTQVDVWLNLGVVYAISGQRQEAEQAWHNVLKYAPDHPAAKAYLAKLATARP